METSTLQTYQAPDGGTFSVQGFEHAQRVAKMLSQSKLVPGDYQGKVENCLIAMEMANRIGASPMAVMQNLHIIQGRPSWSSPFIIASLNSCGRFHPLKFRQVGTPETDSYGYEAFTKTKNGGDEVTGPAVTWAMIKAEGWLGKNGSKWKTMPELMFRYRAAAFFGRLYAPDILMGMHTAEEVIDITPEPEITKEDKAKERLSLLINQASTPEKLDELKEHIKDPSQMDLFNEKMQSFSNVSIA